MPRRSSSIQILIELLKLQILIFRFIAFLQFFLKPLVVVILFLQVIIESLKFGVFYSLVKILCNLFLMLLGCHIVIKVTLQTPSKTKDTILTYIGILSLRAKYRHTKQATDSTYHIFFPSIRITKIISNSLSKTSNIVLNIIFSMFTSTSFHEPVNAFSHSFTSSIAGSPLKILLQTLSITLQYSRCQSFLPSPIGSKSTFLQ